MTMEHEAANILMFGSTALLCSLTWLDSNNDRWYAVANLLSPLSFSIKALHFHMLICICKMGKLPIPFQVHIVARVLIHAVKREPFNILPCHQREIERPLIVKGLLLKADMSMWWKALCWHFLCSTHPGKSKYSDGLVYVCRALLLLYKLLL